MSAILRILFSLTFCVNVYAKPTLKGLGSISYKSPENIVLPPKKIYATDNLKGPIPTNDWWSSILWEKFSSNLFPHPLALNFDKMLLAVTQSGSGSSLSIICPKVSDSLSVSLTFTIFTCPDDSEP